jgi:hypothetical protein
MDLSSFLGEKGCFLISEGTHLGIQEIPEMKE